MLALRQPLAAPQLGQLRGGRAGLGPQTDPYFGDTSTAEGARKMRGLINVSLLGPVTGHVSHCLGSRGNPSPRSDVCLSLPLPRAAGGEEGVWVPMEQRAPLVLQPYGQMW